MANLVKSKYRNVRTEYNGRTFASKREAEHAATLDMLRLASDPAKCVLTVEYQVPFKLSVNRVVVAKYVADFVVHFHDGHTEVHDAKGFRTDVYKLKKKMFEAEYGMKLLEF